MTQAAIRPEEIRALVSGADCVGEREGKTVVSPSSTEEVAALLRFANQRDMKVQVAGAGTKLEWANPVVADLLLQTTRLAGVQQHSWQDLTATVYAGTPWSVMQRTLAAHRQQVALDPLWPERSTVGGIVATNDSGCLRLKYGSLRDLVIGMTIVLADGTVATSGGKVVKNVAGYDLHKLMIGAYGTLGVVTEVTFRLHPLTAYTRVWTMSSTTAEPLGELLLKVMDSRLSVRAMQLRASAEGYALDVELATMREVMMQQIAELDGLAGRVRTDYDPGESADDSGGLFQARGALFDSPSDVIVKATMLASAISKFSTEVVRHGGTAVTQATGIMFARFGEGNAAKVVRALQQCVQAEGDGSVVVVRGPAELRATWSVAETGSEQVASLMGEIKRQFDPKRTLNPRRLSGGI